MLEQAIIDAKELKEAALKAAQQDVVERFSDEVKKKMDVLLEQDLGAALGEDMGMEDPMAGGDMTGEEAGVPPAPQTPVDFAATETDNDTIPTQIEYAFLNGENVGKTAYPDDEQLIEISLDSLSEYEIDPGAGPTKRKETNESVEIDDELLTELAEALSFGEEEGEDSLVDALGSFIGDEEEIIDPIYEEENVDEDKLIPKNGEKCEECGKKDCICKKKSEKCKGNCVAEGVKVDYNFAKEGNPFGSISEQDHINLMLAELVEEVAELEDKVKKTKEKANKEVGNQKELNKRLETVNKALSGKIKEYKDKYENAALVNSNAAKVFEQMKQKFAESQLANAKLLYTNRTLTDASLNERQKDKIVENINKSRSIKETKIVYETLKSTVEGGKKRHPKSLSEAITRKSSPLLIKANRAENKKDSDPFREKMKRLAGIN